MRGLVCLTLALTATWASADPIPEVCGRTPNVARWERANPPDPAVAHMRITVHRGAANLAPENTIPAFEYAIAYGLDMIEVDVQQTLDGRYVVLHDYDVSGKTDGTGLIQTMTYEQATSLNAADNDRWRGSVYDPTYVPGLEAVLDLASRHRVGINFDLKESVTNAAGVALLARAYPGVIERSIFQPYVPGRAEQIFAVAPTAHVMHNAQSSVPPATLYALGTEYDWFGGSRSIYSAEAIAAIHDACDEVQPNVYSDDRAREAQDLLRVRALGADGAMVNNPDVAAATLARPVATTISVDGARACLRGYGELGLPDKSLLIDGAPYTTGRRGCVAMPPMWDTVRFDGDASALASVA